jgi:hypothetical protein
MTASKALKISNFFKSSLIDFEDGRLALLKRFIMTANYCFDLQGTVLKWANFCTSK